MKEDERDLDESQLYEDEEEEEEEDESYTRDIEGFVWLIDEGEGYFLTGNEAFREELEQCETDAVGDYSFSTTSFKGKRGLWFVEGTAEFEFEGDAGTWDVSFREPTPEDFEKYKDQLTFTRW